MTLLNTIIKSLQDRRLVGFVGGIVEMIQYNQICPICGKPFFVTGTQWAYKKTVYSGSRYDKIIYYCSWKCLRIDEKQDQGKHYDGATMRYTMRKQTKGKGKK